MGRLSERVIRDELRQQAMSVPVPTDMWANISRQLDADKAPVVPAAMLAAPAVASQPVAAKRRRPPMRQMLAAGAVAGICWAVLIPLRGYLEPLQTVELSAPAAATTSRPEAPTDVEEVKRTRSNPAASRTSVHPTPWGGEGTTLY